MLPGMFIVFDGIDGSGKSTQIKLLSEELTKLEIPHIVSKEPTNGKYGSIIRQSANGKRLCVEDELDYFIKDRTEHVETLIKPALLSGKYVLLDRYFYSTICYQGARGYDVNELEKQMDSLFIIPDIAFIFSCDVRISRDRILCDKTRNKLDNFEQPDYQEIVKSLFSLCARRKEVVLIDAEQSIENVFEDVMAALTTKAMS